MGIKIGKLFFGSLKKGLNEVAGSLKKASSIFPNFADNTGDIFIKSSSTSKKNLLVPRATKPYMGLDIPEHHYINSRNNDIRHFLNNENSRIRRNPALKKEFEEYIAEIDKSFENLPGLDKEYVFYRGICNERTLTNQTIEMLEKAKLGEIVIPDSAYAYTSYFKDGAIGYAGKYSNIPTKKVLMEIHTPIGAKISCNMEHGGEGLFPRSAKYQILSKEYDKNGILNIVLNYLLPEK